MTKYLVDIVGDNDKLSFVLMIIASAVTLVIIGSSIVIGFESASAAVGLISYGIAFIIISISAGRDL